MYSGWPLLSRENENSLLLFNPHQSGVKGGTAFPCSLPLIIAFFEQVRINFCHPKHHRVLLQHRSLLIHHQLLPVSLRCAETGWIVWISVLEAFIPGVLTPIKPFQEEMRTGATLLCNKSSHLALAGCHSPPPRTTQTRCHLPWNHSSQLCAARCFRSSCTTRAGDFAVAFKSASQDTERLWTGQDSNTSRQRSRRNIFNQLTLPLGGDSWNTRGEWAAALQLNASTGTHRTSRDNFSTAIYQIP